MPSTELTRFKLRPATIVSANRLNQKRDDVIIVPRTSNINRPLTETQYLIGGDEVSLAGIRVESVVHCESIFTLKKSMIIRKLSKLSDEGISQINQCLMRALEL